MSETISANRAAMAVGIDPTTVTSWIRAGKVAGTKTSRGWAVELDDVRRAVTERAAAATVRARFWAKVNKTDGCWLWTGSLTAQGYGHMRVSGGYEYAHRLSYQATFGPIAEGFVIDHLCRNRACCRPEHLEAVRHAENVRRGAGTFAFAGRCMSGKHRILSADDIRPMGNSGTCRACEKENEATRYALVKEAAVALGVPITHFIREHGQSVRAARRILAEVA